MVDGTEEDELVGTVMESLDINDVGKPTVGEVEIDSKLVANI